MDNRLLLRTDGVACTKLNDIEKMRGLYQSNQYFLSLSYLTPRNDYYDEAIDPDGNIRDAASAKNLWMTYNVELMEFINMERNYDSYLDFVCGLEWLLTRVSEGKKFGVEESPIARSSAVKFGEIYGSISEIPEDLDFDLISINHVIEHSENPVDLLKFLLEVQKI